MRDHSSRSFVLEGIVLKRSPFREHDRVVTLLTQSQGKVQVIAKGARSLNSSRGAVLEPANIIKSLCISRGDTAWPLLTQATMVDSAITGESTLPQLRGIAQWLEMMDALFVEEELNDRVYHLVTKTRLLAINPQSSLTELRIHMEALLTQLGFSNTTSELNITQQISQIAERPLHAFEYLTV